MHSFKIPQLNHKAKRLSRYWEALKWLISDSIWRFRRLVISSILSGFLAVFLRIFILGLTLTYARSLEKGSTIDLLEYSIDPQSSIAILLAFSLSCLTLLIGSALLQYISNTTAIKASLGYESYCYQRIIKILASQRAVRNLEKGHLSNKAYLKKLATKDSRFLGISLRNLIKILIPLVETFFYIVFLFLLNYWLTLLILLLLMCSTAIFYQINSTGSKSSKQMEQYSPGATKEASLIIDRMLKFPLPASSVGYYLEDYLTDSFFHRRQVAYGDRLFSVVKAGIVAEIIAASSIFLIFISLGGNSIVRGTGWGELIAYFIILRALNSSVSSASKSFTALNRFYHHFKRYSSFINQVNNTDNKIQNYFQEAICIALASPFRKFKGDEKITLSKGNMLALIAPLKLDIFSLQDIKEIISTNPDSEAGLSTYFWLATSDYQNLPADVQKNPGLTRGIANQGLKQKAKLVSGNINGKSSNLLDAQQAIKVLFSYNFPDDFLNRACSLLAEEDNLCPKSLTDLSSIDRDLKFTLSLLAGYFSHKRIIVFSQEDWFLFPEKVRHIFLEVLRDRLLIVVFVNQIDRIGYSGSNFVAIADNRNRLLDFGSASSWFNENFAAIMRYLNKKTAQHDWLIWAETQEKEDLTDEEDEED